MSSFAANRDQMIRAVAYVRAAVEAHGATEFPELVVDPATMLARTVAAFGLTTFERDVLILAAAVELDGSFAATLRAVSGDASTGAPTLSLALATLPDPMWSALLPDAPLRRWKLIAIDGPSLTAGAMRTDEPFVHALLGFPWYDAAASAYAVALPEPATPLSATQAAVVERAATTLVHAHKPAIGLVCGDPLLGRLLATAIGARIGRAAFLVRIAALPTAPAALRDVMTNLERTMLMTDGFLVLEHEDGDEPQRERTLEAAMELAALPVVVVTRMPIVAGASVVPSFDAARPTAVERADAWNAALGAAATPAVAHRLAAQFDLDLAAIQAVGVGARDDMSFEQLWDRARAQARPRLDTLAEHVEANAGWRDLVLPPDRRKTLRAIVDAVRNRDRVYREWGFDRGATESNGMTVLFSGPSGTGKTMAAKVLARALRLDLYRIDLAVVFSKYIGETEKNLRRIFDAAESGGIVLLFDEADALFGKRSDVKDSHDRHANVEVSYLLQRLERFNGVAVLTTNLRDAVDAAFLRRFAYVVEFPFPDERGRLAIWRRAFPPQTPLHGIDFARLAKLALPGGNIHVIARNAAVRAAVRNRAVTMRDVAEAAQIEYTKIGQAQHASELVRRLEVV